MNNKIRKLILPVIVVLVLVFMPTDFVSAATDEGSAIARFLAWVVVYINAFLGFILTYVMGLVQFLFAWQDINVSGVGVGWAAARDISNMFFILVLLIISFATILRLENYSMKRYMPKLLLMAVLINFSKAICLLLIDGSQIIMLTFAKSFTVSQGSFVVMFGLPKLGEIEFWNNNLPRADGVGSWQLLSGLLFVMFVILITFFIMIMMAGILLARAIAFWILIILSPFAFLAYALPGGGGYFGKWWGQFTKYLMVGPVLAFFTWLAFTIIKGGSEIFDPTKYKEMPPAGITDMANFTNMSSFILGIGLLVGAMKATQSLGAIGGGFGANLATNFKNRGLNLGRQAASWGGQKTWQATKGVTGAGARVGLGLARTADRGLSGVVNTFKNPDKQIQGGLLGTGIQKTGNLVTGKFHKNIAAEKFEADKARFDQHKNGGALKYQGKEYTKTNDGRFVHVDENGKETYAKRKGRFGQDVEIKEMGKVGANHFMATATAKGSAMAAAKMATDASIAEEQKKINAIGMSDEMKLHRLKDNSTLQAEKQAIALDLAEGGGFRGKTHEDVKMAKESLGNNHILLKKFNDSVDKKFAHLNYDMKTEEGRKTFKNRLERGKIDEVMDKSAYEGDIGANVLKTVHDSRGDTGFNKYVNKVGETKTHKDSIVKGLESRLEIDSRDLKNSGKKLDIETGTMSAIRKGMIALTGDIGESLKGIKIDTSEAEKNLQKSLNSLLSSMSVKQIANLDADNFDVGKMKAHFGDDAGKFVNALNLAVSSKMDQKKVLAVSQHEDSTNGLVKHLEEAIRKAEEKKEEKKEEKTTMKDIYGE